jgi:ABC-type dipeptide/oligopeptide/nickel transport system permease subunit
VLTRFLRQRQAQVGVVVLLIIVVATVLGPHLWRYGYRDITPEYSTAPSWSHPMGTDNSGHDLFARVLRGSQKSLQVGVLVAALSTALGLLVGGAAGWYGGVVDNVLMRCTDLVLTVPGIAVLAVLAGALGASGRNWFSVGLILSSLAWTRRARIVRVSFMSLRQQPFVQSARATGAGSWRIVTRHVLPNAAAPIIVAATLGVGSAIVAEAALSYLGLGVTVPDTSLGSLVAAGQSATTTRPWLFWFPGLAIVAIVLSVNLIGDALRRALDPGGS